MAANVKAYLTETEELKHRFKQVNILIHTSRYTTLPLELYEDEQTDLLFYQNLPPQNNEVVLCNILGKSNLVILFGLDKLTHLFLTEHFPNARLFASVSPITEYLAHKVKPSDCCKLFAIFHPESVEVIAFEKEKLLLLNTYPITGLNDSCYYLLNVWQQAGYDQETDQLYAIPLRQQPGATMGRIAIAPEKIHPTIVYHSSSNGIQPLSNEPHQRHSI